ncbi:MAG TPA: SDR family oxidoreductase [Dehalococcoidia bacterium]|nr:SDR family oxidoreductase [Dehalococcoidia bacterium]
MADRLSNKVAIVTGAAQGNGRAIALAFAAEGALVACADINEIGARTVADEIGRRGGKAQAFGMDVTNAADCRRVVDGTVSAFGGLDILVNNAGVLANGTILETEEADWDRVQSVNTKGVYLQTKAALPAILDRGGGSVVIVASMAGLRPRPGLLAYITSKHAAVGMTRSLAIDFAARGVRVNAICPGPIETPMVEQFFAPRGGRTRDEMRALAARELPLGRVGQPEDVAKIAVHLASDEAAWVTGTCYMVDGGSSLAVRV